MKNQQIASLSLKILGIYSIILAVPMIGNLINAFGFPADGPMERIIIVLSVAITFVLQISAGLFLIYFGDRIAKIIIPEADTIESISTLNSRDIQAIAFSIIGVVLIVVTIPKLFQLGANIYAIQRAADNMQAEYKLERDTIAFGVNILCRFILGILLFITGDSLSNIWHKINKRIQYERKI